MRHSMWRWFVLMLVRDEVTNRASSEEAAQPAPRLWGDKKKGNHDED